MITIKRIVLDVGNCPAHRAMCAVKADTGRRIMVTIANNGEIIDMTGKTVKFRALKPDGTSVYLSTDIVNGDVLVTLTEQTLAVPGEVVADLVILDGKNEILSTEKFTIAVSDAPIGEDVPSEDDLAALQEALFAASKVNVEVSEEAGVYPIKITNRNGVSTTVTVQDGAVGPSGIDGKSITDVRVLANNHLECLVGDEWIDAGEIKTIKSYIFGTPVYQDIIADVTNDRPVFIIRNKRCHVLSGVYDNNVYFHSWGTGSDTTKYYVWIRPNDTWGYGDKSVQKTENLVTSITAQSSDTDYPSAKAVYDFVMLMFANRGDLE